MMKRVKDKNGNVFNGIVKSYTGSLVVTDEKEYQKYLHEKHSTKKINELENEVSELKQMIKSLLQQ